MTAWIIGIDRHNPEHWRFAQDCGYWDMTRWQPFDVGDTLYFWQAGRSLLGSAAVTRSTEEIESGTWMPWNIDDEKRGAYRYRVYFTVIHATSACRPTWTQLTTATGVRGGTNFGPRRVPPGGEGWLDAQLSDERILPQVWTLVQEFEHAVSSQLADESPTERDLRARVEATIVMRRGQPRFRRMLFDAYQGRCAITGTAIEGLLEAAHISPYRGDHTDRVDNGLLLRADIHTLFDLHLLTVLSDLTTRVAPDARTDPYLAYDGQRIDVSPLRARQPDPRLLAEHNLACAWLGAEPDRALF